MAMTYFIRAAVAACAIVVGLSLAVANELASGSEDKNAADVESGDVRVEMVTSEGAIVVVLDRVNAPISVQNFLDYVDKKHYDGTVFHRVIDGFMIQGGGLDQKLREKPTSPPIKNESGNGLKNTKYSIAMARVDSDPDSATSQFFINLADNNDLNRDRSRNGYGYAVFGRVVDGQDVVDRIAKTPTQTRPNPAFPPQLMQHVPVDPIILKSVTVQQQKN